MSKKEKKRVAVLLGVIAVIMTAFIVPLLIITRTTTSVKPWSFGVMGDTQWTLSKDPTGENPHYVSAAVARALIEQFIDKGVKFVVHAGDLSDRAGDAAKHTCAEVAQSLYDQGIGYFPYRGNHEAYGYLYGLDHEYNLNIPAFLDAFPQTRGIKNTFNAYNFSSPQIDALQGLSYSFDYGNKGNNARFVIVDVEPTSYVVTQAPVDPVYGQGYFYQSWTVFKATAAVPGGSIPEGAWFRISSSGMPSTNFYGYNNGTNPFGYNPNLWNYPIDDWTVLEKHDPAGTEFWPGSQQSWISGQLEKSSRRTEHAFVFSHRGLMGANHVDCFFGANPGVSPDDQNAFYASLANNGVKYMISGHDHLHNRALVASPDGLSQVEQIISIAGSSKFYSPAALSEFGDVKQREIQISQEIFNIGYYIYTIDGLRVTVDYYSDAVGNFKGDNYYPHGDPDADPPVPGSLSVPDFNFVKKETWGYSLNGKEFLVAQGNSYTVVSDAYLNTTAKILDGVNNSNTTDGNNRPFIKKINTGWTENNGTLKSNILTIWGMANFGTPDATDVFALSMSYDASTVGACALMSKKSDGAWVHATDMNTGGSKKFIAGPYKKGYGLGTYGIDHATKTAWAVINHASNFAVVTSSDGDQNGDSVIDNADVNIVVSYRNQPASNNPKADLDNDGKITALDARKMVLLKTVN